MPRVPGQPFVPAHFLQGLGHREAANFDRHVASGAATLKAVGVTGGLPCLIWLLLEVVKGFSRSDGEIQFVNSVRHIASLAPRLRPLWDGPWLSPVSDGELGGLHAGYL
jgi:hypothetical protein